MSESIPVPDLDERNNRKKNLGVPSGNLET